MGISYALGCCWCLCAAQAYADSVDVPLFKQLCAVHMMGAAEVFFLFARKLAFPEKLLSRLRLFAQGRLWLLCPPQQVFPQLPSFCDLAVLYEWGDL